MEMPSSELEAMECMTTKVEVKNASERGNGEEEKIGELTSAHISKCDMDGHPHTPLARSC